ncbi:PPE family protein [Mycobacterium xenopi 3993]|nr:PPE family protein [Mycobacterium xenopi 3993]
MAEPYVQAQAAWQALAADFTAAMSMLTAEIATVSTLWQGMAAQQAQAAFAPYLAWMDSIVAMAQQRAAAAGARPRPTAPRWSPPRPWLSWLKTTSPTSFSR